MAGLGETMEEIIQVMDDLRSADVDFLTIGQYLQPSPKHYALNRYYRPEEFASLRDCRPKDSARFFITLQDPHIG